MTKQIVIALALVVGTAGAASAQAVVARASVPKIVAATGTPQEIVFPAAVPGGTGGVNVDGTTGTLGYQDYRLNYSGPTVTVPNTVTLASVLTPTNTIPATILCGEAATTVTAPTLVNCSAGIALTHSGRGLVIRRVFVGGSIAQADIDAAVPATDYTGTITIILAQ